jgi:kinesin family protein 6/9
LEQVVIALSTPSREHIPYRQSKLTYYLKDSLGGNCKTLMIANIWGEQTQLEETVSTLKFASRMMRVSNDATINVHMNPEALIKKYEKQITELKQELAMHDQLKGVSQATYDPYTEEQQLELAREIRKFVNNEIEELEVKNMRHIKEMFQQFKKMVQKAESDRDSAHYSAKENLKTGARPEMTGAVRQETSTHSHGVGDIEDGNGFGVGSAAPSSNYRKQTSSVPQTSKKEEGESNVLNVEEEKTPVDRNAAYDIFKNTAGAESIQKMKEENRKYLRVFSNILELLKEKKAAFKILTNKVNDAKKKIDSTKEKIDQKQQENPNQGDNDIVDEEEMLLYQTLKQVKQEYRESFEERKMAKSEIDFVSKAVENSRALLITKFEEWFQETYGQSLDLHENDKIKESIQEEDQLDDGERFEKLEMERIKRDDPESLAFYRAKKGSTKKPNRR